MQADKTKAPSGNPRARGCENRACESEKEIASAREKGRERERERLRPGSMCAVQHTIRIEALSR